MSNRKKKTKRTIQRICVLCEKPYTYKGSCCRNCLSKINELTKEFYKRYWFFPKQHRLSVNKILLLKNYYKKKDIFDFLHKNINLIYDTKFSPQESKFYKKETKTKLMEDLKSNKYDHIPPYVSDFFKKNEHLKFINICGKKENPLVTFKCMKCNEEYIENYLNISKGSTHNCPASVSSGESIVENYLKKSNIKYKTQFDTLKCLNPKTNRQLPYDFELTDYKILIEVQGEQHNEYIPYFHRCKENYEYQLYKDKIKKEYAENKGYKIIYIYYDDFKTNNYINKIKNN